MHYFLFCNTYKLCRRAKTFCTLLHILQHTLLFFSHLRTFLRIVTFYFISYEILFQKILIIFYLVMYINYAVRAKTFRTLPHILQHTSLFFSHLRTFLRIVTFHFISYEILFQKILIIFYLVMYINYVVRAKTFRTLPHILQHTFLFFSHLRTFLRIVTFYFISYEILFQKILTFCYHTF